MTSMTLIISINTIDCNTLVKMDDRKRKNASRNLNLNFTCFDCEGHCDLVSWSLENESNFAKKRVCIF